MDERIGEIFVDIFYCKKFFWFKEGIYLFYKWSLCWRIKMLNFLSAHGKAFFQMLLFIFYKFVTRKISENIFLYVKLSNFNKKITVRPQTNFYVFKTGNSNNEKCITMFSVFILHHQLIQNISIIINIKSNSNKIQIRVWLRRCWF